MTNFSLSDILVVLGGTLVLAIWVAFLYRRTHKGIHYQQGYVQTLVVMAGIIAMIMLIVGSDVAKAFTMMGAFSIIRFRNNMKETRDIGFIFLVMAIGMAMGTKLYLLAMIATLIISGLIYLMYRFDWFAPINRQKHLYISLEPEQYHDGLFDEVFQRFGVKAELLALETMKKENLIQVSFLLHMPKFTQIGLLISELQLQGAKTVSYS